MATQELRWLHYLLSDLGEAPCSPPVLYVDNKAMLALCREHRLEHRTNHIALRYFFARELQQRGQLRLAYVASQANTADVFTKALQPSFDAEGRPVKFETWLDDLHLFLQLTAKEDISLYDHALGHATAPAATADSTARSQWQTLGAAAGAEDPGAGAAAGAVESSVGAAAGAGDPGVGAATGAEDPGVGAAAGAEDPGTGDSAGSGVAARRRPYFVPLLQQVLGLPSSTGPPPPIECPQPVPSQLQFQPASPLPTPSPYTGPLRAPLPSPHESSLPALSDPESDFLRAASPTVARLLATVVTDPSFESTAASALVAELVDFAACCRLDYAASLVAESESVCPPSVGGECALGTDVLEDRQEEFQCLAAASPHLVSVLLTPEGDPDALDIPTPRSYAEAIEGPYSSQWQAAMDAEMDSWKSTGTYVDVVPPPGANCQNIIACQFV
ncbi:unnamed protein product [Closterium sp. NIES-54]